MTGRVGFRAGWSGGPGGVAQWQAMWLEGNGSSEQRMFLSERKDVRLKQDIRQVAYDIPL